MRSRRPDPGLCFAILPLEDQATVARWAAILGLPWHAVPPIRQAVEYVAIALHSADFGSPHGDAVRAASEALGLDDDGASCHPGDRFSRTLGNWHRAAGGKSFRPSKRDPT